LPVIREVDGLQFVGAGGLRNELLVVRAVAGSESIHASHRYLPTVRAMSGVAVDLDLCRHGLGDIWQ
jgi:hypothetical protein